MILLPFSFYFITLRRGMAGAYPADMACKKNKYIEEWNGQREITEKSFSVGFADVPTLFIFGILIPYGMYTWSRSEFLSGTDRRYKDIL